MTQNMKKIIRYPRTGKGASENIGVHLEQCGLEQEIEASQADENTHEEPISVAI
jgi:hypothetical protein